MPQRMSGWVMAGLLVVSVGDRLHADDKPIRIGAVAYAPSAVTIFEGIKKHFRLQAVPVDYVLYSNYDSLVDALDAGHVDVAWNTPLAHAQYHLRCGGESRTLVMRDVDQGFRSVLISRSKAGIEKPSDLGGKTLILGSRDAAEATVLPRFYLAKEGVRFEDVRILSLDEEVDLKGNPCSSERHVLKALREGRGDAGVIGERLWKHIQKSDPDAASELRLVWTTPEFSHCVFTAGPTFDGKRAGRFREVMLAMSPADPTTAEVIRLEGTKQWVAGSPDGFKDLVEALRAEQE